MHANHPTAAHCTPGGDLHYYRDRPCSHSHPATRDINPAQKRHRVPKGEKHMKSMVFALVLTAALTSMDALARSESCHAATQQQIAALFDRWNSSLQTGDPKKVVANYATKSVLLPTVSNTPRLTPAEKEDYFVHFLENKPVGKIDSRTIEIDCNTALDTGLYTFSFKDGNQVKARYTYTYKWNGRQWLITSHHSSAMPEKK
jgi:uncharacterized protein (TIGR02246 family)